MEQIIVDDFLNQRVADMIALGKVISALLGTQTMVEGLACTPTSPASMSVLVSPGQIFSLDAVDSTTYGDLSPTADILGHNVAANAETIMKQGLVLSQTTFALTAPSTSGDSVNYLISAAYEDTDTEDVVLNYFNSSNPTQPLQGPNNSGTAQPTLRQGKCILTLTAGTAAATGTQQTPAVPSGQTGLYVITVASGQTSITASNIAVYPGAPFLSQKLFGLMNGTGDIVTSGTVSAAPATANGECPNLGQFTGLLSGGATSSGYFIVPSSSSPSGKYITQWGYGVISAADTPVTVTYPIAFPTQVQSAQATATGSSTSPAAPVATADVGVNLTSFDVVSSGVSEFFWLATGF